MKPSAQEFLSTWQTNAPYFDALRALASLSKLFSESSQPFLDYRLTENLFCTFFQAINDARSCTAYDARIGSLGVGIKTFLLKAAPSFEKVAEFNKLKAELDPLDGLDLARKLGSFRNTRIQAADNIYKTTQSIYHIVGRTEGGLLLFNVPYEPIDLNALCITKTNTAGITFDDGKNEYNFNRSKSVLLKRFHVPTVGTVPIPVNILEDPLRLLLAVLRGKKSSPYLPIKTLPKDYVILPLYSTRGKLPSVPERSGLNQWNAEGRPRDFNEVYIPIPKRIHTLHPGFFPPRDEHFALRLPHGEVLTAKVCQEGSKALMSAPNAALGKWLLRQVLRKAEGTLVTMEDLNIYGIDSVKITNEHTIDDLGRKCYSIAFTVNDYEPYSDFATRPKL